MEAKFLLVGILAIFSCQDSKIKIPSGVRHSHLVDFYSGIRSDNKARMLDKLWHLDDAGLEKDDAAFEWLLPTKNTGTDFNNPVPPVSTEEAKIFLLHSRLRANYEVSLARMARFYGFILVWEDKNSFVFKPGLNLEARMTNLGTNARKQELRLRRFVESMRLLYSRTSATNFISALELATRHYPGNLNPKILARLR